MAVPRISSRPCVARISKPSCPGLPTKDGGTLRTVLDVRSYMLVLPKHRETSARWQHAVALLMGQADVERQARCRS
jgi:hypothetical protein